MGKKRKIGKVNRKPGTFVYVDKHGNVWEMERPKGKGKNKRKR